MRPPGGGSSNIFGPPNDKPVPPVVRETQTTPASGSQSAAVAVPVVAEASKPVSAEAGQSTRMPRNGK